MKLLREIYIEVFRRYRLEDRRVERKKLIVFNESVRVPMTAIPNIELVKEAFHSFKLPDILPKHVSVKLQSDEDDANSPNQVQR